MTTNNSPESNTSGTNLNPLPQKPAISAPEHSPSPAEIETEANFVRAMILFDLNQMILTIPDFLPLLEDAAKEIEAVSDYYPQRLIDYARNFRKQALGE